MATTTIATNLVVRTARWNDPADQTVAVVAPPGTTVLIDDSVPSTPADRAVSLSGVSAAGSLGDFVLPGDKTRALSGVSAAGALGGFVVPPAPGSTLLPMTVGENMNPPVIYDRSPIFVDLLRQGQWDGAPSGGIVPTDSNGYPNADFRVAPQWLAKNANSAQIHIFIEGNPGSVTCDWAIVSNVYNSGADTAEIVIQAPATGDITGAHILFTNTKKTPASATGSGVRRVRVIRPGYEGTPDQIVTNEFAAVCADFEYLRWMKATGGEFDTYTTGWSLRPIVTRNRMSFPTIDSAGNYFNNGPGGHVRGMALEHIIAISNELHRSMWVSVPPASFDDYASADAWEKGAAALVDATLDAGLWCVFEVANEVWNIGPYDNWARCADYMAQEVHGFWNDNGGRSFGRYATSMVASGGVLTIVTSKPHGLTTGNRFTMPYLSQVGSNAPVTVVNPITFRVPTTLPDQTLSVNNSGLMGGSPDAASPLVHRDTQWGRAFDLRSMIPVSLMDRTIKMSDNIRAVVGDAKMFTRFFPVWCWQNVRSNPTYREVLDWCEANVAHPSTKLGAFVGSCYFYGKNATGHSLPVETSQPHTVQNILDAYALNVSKIPTNPAFSTYTNYAVEQYLWLSKRFGVPFWTYEAAEEDRMYGVSTSNPAAMTANEKSFNDNMLTALFDPAWKPLARAHLDNMAIAASKMTLFTASLGNISEGAATGTWYLTADSYATVSPKWQAVKDFNVVGGLVLDRNPVPGVVDAKHFLCRYDDRDGTLPFPQADFGWQDTYMHAVDMYVRTLRWIVTCPATGARTIKFTYQATAALGGNVHFNLLVNDTVVSPAAPVDVVCTVPGALNTDADTATYSINLVAGVNTILITGVSGLVNKVCFVSFTVA